MTTLTGNLFCICIRTWIILQTLLGLDLHAFMTKKSPWRFAQLKILDLGNKVSNSTAQPSMSLIGFMGDSLLIWYLILDLQFMHVMTLLMPRRKESNKTRLTLNANLLKSRHSISKTKLSDWKPSKEWQVLTTSSVLTCQSHKKRGDLSRLIWLNLREKIFNLEWKTKAAFPSTRLVFPAEGLSFKTAGLKFLKKTGRRKSTFWKFQAWATLKWNHTSQTKWTTWPFTCFHICLGIDDTLKSWLTGTFTTPMNLRQPLGSSTPTSRTWRSSEECWTSFCWCPVL